MNYLHITEYDKEETLIEYFTHQYENKHNQKYLHAEDDSKPKGKKPRKEDFNEQRNRKRGLE